MTQLTQEIGSPPYTYSKLRVTDTIDTPNWKQLVREGKLLPINPHGLYIEETVDPMYWTYNGWRNCHTAGYPLYRTPWGILQDARNGPNWDRYVQLVQNRLAKQARSIDVDIGVALGELPETVKMITSAAKTLGLAAIAARRGDAQGVVRHLFGTNAKQRLSDIPKSASGTWLGYSYGVRPFLNDVYAAVTAFEEGLKRPNRSRVLTRIPVEYREDKIFTQTSQGSAKRLFSASGSCCGVIEYEVTNPTYASLGSCGLTNPASTAWGLFPLSFVADWFVPVGDFISSLAPPAGLSFKRGWVKQSVSGQMRNIVNYPGFFTDGTCNFKRKNRYVLTDFPRFQFSFDEVSFDLNKSQVASALSLLTQRILK